MDLASFSQQLQELRERALSAVSRAADPRALDEVESNYLGRRGELRTLLGTIGQLPAADRPQVGALANPIRQELEAQIAARRERLDNIALEVRLARERTDVTLPGRPMPRGSLHPLHETEREIARIFGQFGFVTFESPEVETDELNFQLLNIPQDHPSRDLWDTLYVLPPTAPADGAPPTATALPPADTAPPASSAAPPTNDGLPSPTNGPPAPDDLPPADPSTFGPRLVLRTHTSPGQVRAMRQYRPPIRVLVPGRCYRYEAVDASHGFEFFQVEGLMVDDGTTMAHLRGLLDEFAHAMFGRQTGTRFRPGYYPFTEPSVAFDISCLICGGVGCPACKRSGWLTILGAGMVHPVVLSNGGIDPESYQGFAFGMGIDRIAMLRHGIPDIRAFIDNDLRFLERF